MIYLDHAATTPVDPEVLAAYTSLISKHFANSASIHHAGQQSARLLQKAREQILSQYHLENHEVIFTSGATEAINLALKGYAFANSKRGKHIITSAVEHPAVKNALIQLRDHFGFEVTFLPVDQDGCIRPDDLVKTFRNDTILVALMAVNNEIGTLFPTGEIARIVRDHPKAVYFSDTTQAIGKLPLDYPNLDMFVISAHKINGLKGSGALIKKKTITLLPLLSGGGQENDLRSGTSDFPVHVMLAKTLRLAEEHREASYQNALKLNAEARRRLALRNDILLNSPQTGSPFILNFSLLKKKASVVVEALSLKDIMVSSVSACSSSKFKESDVLLAISEDSQRAANTIRLSFGKDTTMSELSQFFDALDETLRSLR